MSRYLFVLLACSLSACGMKGSLEYPPGPPPEPLLGKQKPAAKPATTAAPAAKDGSTDKNRNPE